MVINLQNESAILIRGQQRQACADEVQWQTRVNFILPLFSHFKCPQYFECDIFSWFQIIKYWIDETVLMYPSITNSVKHVP